MQTCGQFQYKSVIYFLPFYGVQINVLHSQTTTSHRSTQHQGVHLFKVKLRYSTHDVLEYNLKFVFQNSVDE